MSDTDPNYLPLDILQRAYQSFDPANVSNRLAAAAQGVGARPIFSRLENMAGTFGRSLAAPGNALQSTEPITTEEMLGPGMDLGSILTLGAGAMPAEGNTLRAGISAGITRPLAIKDAIPSSDVLPGFVRLWRGGGNNPGGPKWVTTSRKYAEGYTTPGLAHSDKAGSYLQYVDVPSTDPRVQMPPGQSVHSFEAPADIADQLQPFWQRGDAPLGEIIKSRARDPSLWLGKN